MRGKKRDPIGGDTSEIAPRVIAMIGVAVLCVVLLRYSWPEHTALSVLCGMISAVFLLILFAGNERHVRPLMFVFKPLITLVKWLGSLLEMVWFLR